MYQYLRPDTIESDIVKIAWLRQYIFSDIQKVAELIIVVIYHRNVCLIIKQLLIPLWHICQSMHYWVEYPHFIASLSALLSRPGSVDQERQSKLHKPNNTSPNCPELEFSTDEWHWCCCVSLSRNDDGF